MRIGLFNRVLGDVVRYDSSFALRQDALGRLSLSPEQKITIVLRMLAYDMRKLLQESSRRGFPRMISSIDCMHWEWRTCPTAWKGAYTDHMHRPTIILEAVASYNTWI
ncbi:hypothetical protein LINPERPRIM_LOCUS633, partial [Linum perenne]